MSQVFTKPSYVYSKYVASEKVISTYLLFWSNVRWPGVPPLVPQLLSSSLKRSARGSGSHHVEQTLRLRSGLMRVFLFSGFSGLMVVGKGPYTNIDISWINAKFGTTADWLLTTHYKQRNLFQEFCGHEKAGQFKLLQKYQNKVASKFLK